MADKEKEKQAQELENILEKSNIKKINIEHEMKKSFIAYAMAVNVSRAIPDVRDGLKPVHRRILYAMSELGLTSDKPYRKCARIVGDVLGKYHPHGDTAVYEALVRLAQDFSIRCPLVDGHGNFGSVDGDPPAAQRYTEARMSKIAAEMIRDIDKKTVDYYPNFDDTLMQPVVLPSRYPNLLVNGSDGIAVGMATSIPPHNLGEVIDGTIALMENPEMDIEELIDLIPAPDYPTGALIMGRSGIKKAYRTGKGSAILRARAEIEDFNNGTRQRIVITELPYQVNKAKLIETIAEYVKQKRIEGISDIQEQSDRDGMRIVIDVKKDAQAQVVLNMLYKHTSLQISNSIILLALIDGTPKVMNLKEILTAYIEHQKQVIVRRTQYDLEKALEKEHILKGLVIALYNIDEVVAIIKKSEDKYDAANKLMETFALSDKQANAILEMRLQRLTHLEIDKLEQNLDQLEKDIAEYRDILAKPHRVEEIIKTEMLEIKEKYNTPRRSELSYDYNDIDIEDLIEKEDIVISLTHQGYIKRMATDEYKAQRRGGVGVTAHKAKDEDFVENVFNSNTHEPILFFSNFGKVYRLKAYMIPEGSKTAKGRAMVNLLNLADGERINAILPLAEGSEGYLALATKKGLIKKTALSEFERIQSNGKIAIRLQEGDELIGAMRTDGDNEIIIASTGGKCIRFHEQDIRDTGRSSMGVKSISLDKGEFVVDATIVRENTDVLTITENGYGKRTDIDEYRFQSRGGKGIKVGVLNEKTGNVVNLKLVSDDEDVMILADNGVVIRLNADSISKIGRNTQGVRLMRLKDEESKVVSFTIVPRSEEEPAEDALAETDGEDIQAEDVAESIEVQENNKESVEE